MNNYPKYIHVPTTVPVQRYFANPYVPINSYAWGGFDSLKPTLTGNLGVTGTGATGQWMSLGDKAEVGLGKIIGKLGGNPTSALGSLKGGLADAVGGAVGQGLYSLGTGKFDRGIGAGKAISGIGNAVGGIVGKVNPLLGGIVKAGSGLVGGLVNRIGGYHLNDATINAINSDVNEMNNTRVTDSSNESIANQAAAQNWGGAFDIHDIGSWGWAAKGKVENEYNKLQKAMASGQNYMAANYDNAETNVSKNMMNNLLMNSAAFGGYFDNPFSHPGSGAIAYGIEQQNLQNQQQMLGQIQQLQNPFCFGGKKFANGGSIHGSDFTNGVMLIDAGGTHEQNPYQGVQIGTDRKGVPNMVEEGEMLYKDYVYSNRLNIPDDVAEKLHIPKGKTFAEGGRLLQKESDERPNDPISLDTLDWSAGILREAQELVKQEKAQKEQEERQELARQFFEQLPPDQQRAALQEMQVQQQPMQLQSVQQEGTPIQQPMMAFGGNLFSNGGYFQLPVNLYVDGGDDYTGLPNMYNEGYNRGNVFMQYGAPFILQFLKKAKEDGKLKEGIELINNLQKANVTAGLNATIGKDTSRKNKAYDNIQKAAKELGFDNIFTDDFFDKVIDSSTHKGGTPDKAKEFGLDQTLGGQMLSRNAGVVPPEGTYEGWDDFIKQLNDLGVTAAPGTDALQGMYEYSEYNPSTSASTSSSDKAFMDRLLGNTDNSLQARLSKQLSEGVNGKDSEGYNPELYPTWMRYAPVWASGIATLTDALGLTNKPDFSDANGIFHAAMNAGRYMPTSFKPISNVDLYNPFDLNYYLNQVQARDAATMRAIQDNSNGNGALANAAQVAAGRNAGLEYGDALMQADELDMKRKSQDAQTNTQINMFNSEGIAQSDATNAALYNRAKQSEYTGLAAYYDARQKEKAAAAAARSANLSNFVKSLAGIGRENFAFNQINTNPYFLYHVRRNGAQGYKEPGQVESTQPSSTPSWQTGIPSLATPTFTLQQPMPSWAEWNMLFGNK